MPKKRYTWRAVVLTGVTIVPFFYFLNTVTHTMESNRCRRLWAAVVVVVVVTVASGASGSGVTDARNDAGRYVSAASLSVMMAGTSQGWPSPVLQKWAAGRMPIAGVTGAQHSWMIAALELGNLVSPVPFGLLADAIGRKPCLLLTGPLYAASWLTVARGRSVAALYWARLLQGACMGVVTAVAPVYIGEIAGDAVRGALGTFVTGMLNAGVLYVYCAGPPLSYEGLAYAALAVPCAFTVACLWIPESPHYYALRGDDGRARTALLWLRGGDATAAARDLGRLKAETAAAAATTTTTPRSAASKLFGCRRGRRAFLVVQTVAAAEALSGMTAVLAYASTAFAQGPDAAAAAAGSPSPDQFAVFFAALLVAATFAAGYLVDRLGRRPLLLFSCLGCGAFQLLTGAYYYVHRGGGGGGAGLNAWAPFAGVGAFAVVYSAGLGPLLPTLQAEMFASDVRGLASAVTSAALTAVSFAVLKAYQPVADRWGVHVNYLTYGAGCLCASALVYRYLPETKGKTFARIQAEIGAAVDSPPPPPPPLETGRGSSSCVV